MAENNSALALAVLGLGNKGASKSYVDGEIDLVNARIDALPHGMQYKGVVLYYDLLPTTNVEVGDLYTIKYLGLSTEAGETLWGAEFVCAKIEDSVAYYEEIGLATNVNIVGENLVLGNAVGTVVDTTLVF